MAIIGEWIRPIENHLYWSALTTSNGDGRIIWATFKSILCHIKNKHTGFNDPIFNKCAHDDNISERKWLQPGQQSFNVSSLMSLYCVPFQEINNLFVILNHGGRKQGVRECTHLLLKKMGI